MTISSTVTKVSFSANGSTTVFAYSFKIFAATDLEVIVRTDATGSESVQTLTTHYSVSGAGSASGGNVTFGSAPASGTTVVIRRKVPITQGTDYVENDSFGAESHEDALDRLTIIAQQQQEEVDRTIKAPATDTATLELPTSTARASRLMAFDGSGNITTTAVDSLSLATLQAFTDFKTTTGTGNGSTTTITLSADPGQESNTQVYLDGVYQSKSTYTVSGTTLTFSTAPPSGVAIEVIHGTAASTYVPAASSITFAQLADTIDEDNMASDSATKIPTQQSVKAYVDANAVLGAEAVARSYGVVPGTNITTAFNSMISSVRSAGITRIQFESGTYQFDAAPSDLGGLRLVGAGSSDTIFRVDYNPASDTAGVFSFVTGKGGGMRGIQITANQACQQGVAIRIAESAGGGSTDGDYTLIEDVNISEAHEDGQFYYGIALVGDQTTGGIRDVDVFDADIFACSQASVFIDGGVSCTLSDVRGFAAGGSAGKLVVKGTQLATVYTHVSDSQFEYVDIDKANLCSFSGNLKHIDLASDVTNCSVTSPHAAGTVADAGTNNTIDAGITRKGNLTLDGDITLPGGTSGRNVVWDKSDNALEFADSAKAIFGTGPDLSIYHDGLNSYVTETSDGTGNLFVLASNLVLGDQGNAHSYLSGASGGAVTIYHDNAQKFVTTSGGISVTGEVAATSLDISGDADIDGTLEADAMTLNGTAITATATLDTGISNNNVPKFTSGVADNDFLRVDGTAIEGRSAAEVLSDIAAAPAAGSSNIVTTGALNSGSITSGFGSIDNGSSAITTTGTVSAGDVNATGDVTVGDDLHLDSDSAVLKFGDDAEITLTHVHNAGLSLNSNLYIADSKSINIGGSNDLSLFHDTNDSHIVDQGSGNLFVKTNGTAIRMETYGGDDLATFTKDGSVDLFYDDSKKFETTASGVAVTGDISATGDATIGDDLHLDSDSAVLKFGDDAEITLTHNHDVGLALNTGSTIYRTGTGQYDAGFSVREGTAGKAHFEWGHGNTSGYGCTLATTNGGGAPYVGWNCGPGTESNTWRTYGIRGLAQLVSHGVMYFYDVADTTQDNQGPSGTANKEGTDSVARITLNATNGNLSISGALSKGSGSFLIDHPLAAKKDTHNLRYSFVESPYCELNHRGRVQLSGGSATVDIDAAFGMTAGTFEALSTNPQVWLQNNDGWTAVKGSVSGSTLTITAQDADCTDEIDWLVIAERADPHILETDWTGENGRPIVEPEKTVENVIENIAETN